MPLVDKKFTPEERLAAFADKAVPFKSELGGQMDYRCAFSGVDFLTPLAELREELHAFSSSVQRMVNSHESD